MKIERIFSLELRISNDKFYVKHHIIFGMETVRLAEGIKKCYLRRKEFSRSSAIVTRRVGNIQSDLDSLSF